MQRIGDFRFGSQVACIRTGQPVKRPTPGPLTTPGQSVLAAMKAAEAAEKAARIDINTVWPGATSHAAGLAVGNNQGNRQMEDEQA